MMSSTKHGPRSYNGDARRAITEYLTEDASQLKSWWKAKRLKKQLSQYNHNQIGKALAAIYADPDDPLIQERISGSHCYRYRVNFNQNEAGTDQPMPDHD